MKIKNNSGNKNTIQKLNTHFFVYKKSLKRVSLFFIAIALLLCGFKASRFIKTKGYNNLWDFVSTVSSNYLKGLKANPENISIEIKDKDFKFLEKNRENALERNVIINDIDGDYVPATFEYKGKKMDVKLRLKGHMTDHLQDNKWSFRVKVKGNDSFMGMKRFSLQHPGTRGYIYEWIYHELMKREGIIALRYKFINLSVNGNDWGIYAVEENFDDELLENNQRKKGPIIRFNPDLYWVDRYNEIKNEEPLAEFASYYSAPVEAYNENKVVKDSIQRKYYLNAMALMEGFRSRKLSVSQVFDVDRLAKFHAVIDLVGGQHSIDWSDIKYYYNPVSEKLEPIAYESFTQFPFEYIVGNYKYVQLDSGQYYTDLHSAIFSDSVFFRAYIKQLIKISNSSYLDQFFDASNVELNNNLTILCKEFPYKKFDKGDYYKNQSMIKLLLSAPRGLHAYFNSVSDNMIRLQLGAIESLPIEVRSISIDNYLGLPIKTIILPAKQSNVPVSYQTYMFAIPSGIKWSDSLVPFLKINYSILGASAEIQSKVFSFPHTDNEFISADLKNRVGNVSEFSFLKINKSFKIITIEPGKHVIDKDIIIPEGFVLNASNNTILDIRKNAKILSYSSIIFEGTEDEHLLIESSDSTSEGIEVINAPKSIMKYVTFKNLQKTHDKQWARSGSICFYESPIEFSYCSFYDSKAVDAIDLIRSKFSFKECLFHKMDNNALNIDFSEGTINNCVFENCKKNALSITMGNVKVKSLYFNDVGKKGLSIKGGSDFSGNDIRIKNATIGLSAEDLSNINLQNITISDSEIGVAAYANKSDDGSPIVKLTGLTLTRVEKNYLKERKSTIMTNGIEIIDNTDDVEAIIKGDKKKHK